MKWGAVLLASLASVGCRGVESPGSEDAGPYFEVGSFCPGSGPADELMREYAGVLAAMGEPPLVSACKRRRLVCRFLWLPSFDGPIAVRWEPQEEGLVASVAVLATAAIELREDGSIAYGDASRRTRRLPNVSWSQLASRVDATGFWKAPTLSGFGSTARTGSSSSATAQDAASWSTGRPIRTAGRVPPALPRPRALGRPPVAADEVYGRRLRACS